MQCDDVVLPAFQVQQQSTVSLMDAGHQSHPRQAEPVDPADAAAEKNQFQSGAGAFQGIQLVVVVFVVDHGDAAEQTEKNGDRKHGPVKAKNSGGPGGVVVLANLCGAASGALQVERGVGLVKDPAMARQRINPNAKPISLKALEK